MLYRRLLIPLIAGALIIAAVESVSSVMAPGRDWEAVLAAALATALAALWRGRSRLFFPTALVAGTLLALCFSAATLGSSRTASGIFFLLFAPFYLSAFAGWLIFHEREPWPVAVIAVIAVVMHADVSHEYEAGLPLFVAATLILVLAVYAPDVRRFWLSLPAAICGFSVIALTWQLPAVHIVPISGAFTAGNNLTSLLSVSDGAETRSLDLTGPFHPSSLALFMASPRAPFTTPPYWQSAVFDRFDGHSWTASASLARAAPPDELLLPEPLAFLNNSNTVLVQLLQSANVLISPGTPLTSSVSSTVYYSADGLEPLQLTSARALPTGSAYTVVGAANPQEPLSAAEGRMYLQLPSEPPSFRTLSDSLTGGIPDALAKASAIIRFLRDSGRFQYDPNVGSPAGQNAVNAFLFETHRGYCTQFASAFALLSRAAGIPTRVVAGYDSGELLSDGSYVVRARDAHSWDQVFVQSRGWVTFDPTPGYASGGYQIPPSNPLGTHFPLRRPPGANPARARLSSGQTLHAPGTTGAKKSPASSAPEDLLVAGSTSLLLALLLSLAYALRPRPVGELYAALARHAPTSQTPLEFAETFRTTPHYKSIRYIAHLHTAALYAGRAPTPSEQRAAWKKWLRLRLRLVR